MADIDPELLKKLLDPESLAALRDPRRHSDLALAEDVDRTHPNTSRLVPEVGAAPSLDRAAAATSLSPIGETKGLPMLSHKEQRGLPQLSPGVSAGSSGDLENQLERLRAPRDPITATGARGVLQHIGRGLEKVGNIAGDIYAPGIMANIPGTDLNKHAQIHQIETRLPGVKEKESEAAERTAQTKKIEKETEHIGEAPPKEEEWSIVPNVQGPNGEPVQQEKHSGQVRVAPAEGVTAAGDEGKQPIKTGGVTQHSKELDTLTSGMTPDEKKNFTDAYSVKPTDTHAIATKRLEDAKASAQLSASERDRKLQRDIANRNHEDQQSQLGLTNSLQTVEFTDPKSGEKLVGSYAEAQAAGAKNPRKVQPGAEDKSREFYSNSARLLQNAQAVNDSLPAWDNAKDKDLAMRVQKQFVNGLHAPGVGGITGEYIDTFLNSEDFKNMTPAGQTHMQNTLQLYSDILQLIKTETGANPRGEVMFETEKKILPSPEKTQEMNRQAIDQLEKRIRADAKAKSRPTDLGPLQGIIPTDAKSRLRDPDTNHVVGYVDKDGKRVVW